MPNPHDFQGHRAKKHRAAIAVRILAVHGLPAARQRKEAVHGARPRAFHLNLIAHNLLGQGVWKLDPTD